MKLWQKIFLISLTLIIAVVNIISITLLNNSHRLLMERERSHSINEHEYFTAAFINALTYEKLAEEVLVLTNDEIAHVAENMVNSENRAGGIAIYSDSEIAISKNISYMLNKNITEKFLGSIDKSGSNYSISVFDDGDKRIMVIGSAVDIETACFFIITATDVSEIYAVKEQQADFVRKVSIGSSAVISLILLVMVIILLRPLSRLNIYAKAIAGGNYNLRIRKKGSPEFKKLAENMNKMADSVQLNAMRLENIAEARQTFIANLAHEMKTPLTSILGFADLLRIKKNVSDSDRIEYAGVIVEETKRLRSLSGKLMELVALGGTEIEKTEVSLPKIIKETETALAPLLAKNSVTLLCSSEDIVISADEELFKSLLYNIIENAVKASPKGGKVNLNAEIRDENVVISITDNGIGMTNEQIKRVFEPFYMADKSRSRKAGGAGLGLSLCAEIVKLHGAFIDIKSVPDKGTSVIINIRSPRELPKRSVTAEAEK